MYNVTIEYNHSLSVFLRIYNLNRPADVQYTTGIIQAQSFLLAYRTN